MVEETPKYLSFYIKDEYKNVICRKQFDFPQFRIQNNYLHIKQNGKLTLILKGSGPKDFLRIKLTLYQDHFFENPLMDQNDIIIKELPKFQF